MDEAQGRASADYGTGDFDEDKSQNRCSSAIDFVLSANVRRKRNLNEKERPNLTQEREKCIAHRFVLSMNNN